MDGARAYVLEQLFVVITIILHGQVEDFGPCSCWEIPVVADTYLKLLNLHLYYNLFDLWHSIKSFLDCPDDLIEQVLIWTNHDVQVNFDLYVDILIMLFLQVLLVFHSDSKTEECISSQSLQVPIKDRVIRFRNALLLAILVDCKIFFKLS